jgi:hypothetical protein
MNDDRAVKVKVLSRFIKSNQRRSPPKVPDDVDAIHQAACIHTYSKTIHMYRTTKHHFPLHERRICSSPQLLRPHSLLFFGEAGPTAPQPNQLDRLSSICGLCEPLTLGASFASSLWILSYSSFSELLPEANDGGLGSGEDILAELTDPVWVACRYVLDRRDVSEACVLGDGMFVTGLGVGRPDDEREKSVGRSGAVPVIPGREVEDVTEDVAAERADMATGTYLSSQLYG